MRALLRNRGHLVRLRTSQINSLKGIICRDCGCHLPDKKIKQVRVTILPHCWYPRKIEVSIQTRVEIFKQFSSLKTAPGTGLILSMTIMLETGDISCFAKVGNFSSYCRKVPTSWTSNGKKKGRNKGKNGNKHLA